VFDPRKTSDRRGHLQVGCCRKIHDLTANEAFEMSTSGHGFTRITIRGVQPAAPQEGIFGTCAESPPCAK
jgi:hypothetical protein